MHLGLGDGEQLTLGKAVPRVDMAIVDIHDVHTLVPHEVPLMPIALWGEHGSHLQVGALSKAKSTPPRTRPPPPPDPMPEQCGLPLEQRISWLAVSDKAGIQPQNLAP